MPRTTASRWGSRSGETADLNARFVKVKQLTEQTLQSLTQKMQTQSRFNRALRLGRMPRFAGSILPRLEETRALKDLRVIGTHALFACESMARADLKVELLVSGDDDLRFGGHEQIVFLAKRLADLGLIELLP